MCNQNKKGASYFRSLGSYVCPDCSVMRLPTVLMTEHIPTPKQRLANKLFMRKFIDVSLAQAFTEVKLNKIMNDIESPPEKRALNFVETVIDQAKEVSKYQRAKQIKERNDNGGM